MPPPKAATTALAVAWARAAASARPMTSPPLEDDVAERLLPGWMRALIPRGGASQQVSRVATLGLVDHLALRSAAIDAEITLAHDQIVIVGAGFDGRAHRLDRLAHATVFEVDRPEVSELKQASTRGSPVRARALRYVSVDLSRVDPSDALADAGHDASRPTLWIIEGVVPYLPADATRTTIARMASRSARGSVVALTYVTPSDNPFEGAARRLFDAALHVTADPLGDPLEPEQVARFFDVSGFRVRDDSCNVDWSARFGASSTIARIFRAERLAVAVR